MDLRDRHRILLMSGGGLPPGYKRADYLQTSGFNARIDTGIAGDNEALVLDFDIATATRQAYAAAMGNYTNDNTRCWRLINPPGTGESRSYLFTAYNAKAGSSPTISAVPEGSSIVGARVNFRISNGQAVAKCGNYTATVTTEPDGTTSVSTENICIGAPNSARTGGTLVVRYWYFKIWNGAALVRNYVPCIRLSDSKAGFYDLANHTFNPSIGSVDFVAGYDS